MSFTTYSRTKIYEAGMFSKRDLMNIEGIMMLHAIKKSSGKRNAARGLHTSIDTLNKYLRNLEMELGVKLVASDEKGCLLTPKGDKVFEIAEIIKGNLQQVYAVAPLDTEVKGEVRVAYDSNVRCNLYTMNLRGFLDKYPNLSIYMDMYNSTPDMSNLAYDISLSYHIPKGEDLVVITERKTPCGFYASKTYLENHGYPQSLDEILDNHRLILKQDCWKWVDGGHMFFQKASKGLCVSNSTFIVNDIVMKGGGIGVMPVNFMLEGQGIVRLDGIPCVASSTIYLVSHRTVKDLPKVCVVLEYYKKMLQDM